MNWDLICRVCLEGGEMVSMFDSDENNELLRDIYKYTTEIEVSESDTLPNLICLTCVDRLMFAYQFKQQCIASNDTLKECLAELSKSSVPLLSGQTAGSEVVSIKHENGVYLKYELPIERADGLEVTPNRDLHHEVQVEGADISLLTPKRRRGRPRKEPKQKAKIAKSPRRGKERPVQKEKPCLSDDIKLGISLKEELDEDFLQEDFHEDDADPDFEPLDHSPAHGEPSIFPAMAPKKKRRRLAKKLPAGKEEEDILLEETIMANSKPLADPLSFKKKKPRRLAQKLSAREKEEDILLKETIMAYSEPLDDSILKPKEPNTKKPKKSYHMKNTKSYTCETCGKSFASNASLQAHIRRHLGIKPFVCSICNYSFVVKMELRIHMMRHTGQKPYMCRICERRFADYGSRQKHERLHIGERPFQCSMCDKSFTYRNVLNNHMLTHTGEKKYSCEPCNRKFTLSKHLKYHNQIHHKELYLQQQMELEAKRKPLLVVQS